MKIPRLQKYSLKWMPFRNGWQKRNLPSPLYLEEEGRAWQCQCLVPPIPIWQNMILRWVDYLTSYIVTVENYLKSYILTHNQIWCSSCGNHMLFVYLLIQILSCIHPFMNVHWNFFFVPNRSSITLVQCTQRQQDYLRLNHSVEMSSLSMVQPLIQNITPILRASWWVG